MSSPDSKMAPFTVPKNLPDLVRAAFSRARASGDVHFYPTEAAVLDVNSIPVCYVAWHHSSKTPFLPSPGKKTP